MSIRLAAVAAALATLALPSRGQVTCATDNNGDGLIDRHEARAMLRDAGSEGSLSEAEQAIAAFNANGRGAISWAELKAAVDDAATPVDGRVRPIYLSLTLLFTSQGTQFPVLPQARHPSRHQPSNRGCIMHP